MTTDDKKLLDEARQVIANIKAAQRAGLLPLNDAKDMIAAVIQDVGYRLEIITEPITESGNE
jgi:hypothetical protein